QVILAQVGNPVTLPRMKWGQDEKVHVDWSFNDISLIRRNPTNPSIRAENTEWQGRISLSSDFSLIISRVNASDFGTFKCLQHELVNEQATTYILYDVSIPAQEPLLVNAALTLSCVIDQKAFVLVHPSVQWIGPDNKIYSGQQSMNKNTLTVKTVSGKHSGIWTCELKYNGGITLKAMTDVTIVDLAPSTPDPIYTHDSVYNLNIPCSFSSKMTWSTLNKVSFTEGSWSFSPLNRSESSRTLLDLNFTPSTAWKSPDGTQNLLMESEVKDTVLDVKISKVSVNNRGTYTCNLKFGSQTISRNVQVEVLQVISSAGKVIYAGYPLNLTCTLGHPLSSDLEVNWIAPHGSSLQNLNNPHPMQLSIPAVELKDRGRWICELKKNSTVLTSATFTLKVENAPVNLWMIIAIVVGVLVLFLIIGITVIYVRRCREVKYRRRKRRYCCC
ncbi:CD4-1 molecule isoform X1, partial [Silurus asotus]